MDSEITQPDAPPASPQDRFAAAYRVLGEAIAARAFPGCAFGVLTKGEVVLSGALGSFTYDATIPAVAPETVYDVASITKVVSTTASAMLLHQRGLLNLDTLLGDLLPGFVQRRAHRDMARQIKLRHLLAHNSGLPGYVDFFHKETNAEDLFSDCLALPVDAEPGMHVEYSDPGFTLLGKALEVVTGEPLATWAPREIFEPLGLTATCFNPPPEVSGLIPPSEMDPTFRHRRIQGEVQDENAWMLGGATGHAGVFSNVPDLLRFAQEILAADTNSADARIFNAATIELFAKRQGPPDSSRALGWDTPSENSSAGRHFSPHSIGHLGFSGCSLWIDLDAGVVITLLTNRTWPDRQSQLIRKVRPAFHDAIREAL
jgi:CubicO group peptidase (beta-lactamase class C family)